jgi:outer membrane protein TolC
MQQSCTVHGLPLQVITLVLLSFSLFSANINAEQLSGPLTLAKALSFADSDQPELSLVDAELAYAVSRKLQVDTRNNLDAYIEVAPYMSEPTTGNEFLSDSYVRLSVSKTLYDFGYSKTLEDSADEGILSKELIAEDTRNKNYLKIMQLYFDVLLADLHYAAVDEEMTTRYVTYDKLRERHSLGMVSDVVLATAESVYRELADLRKVSEKEQQSSRQRLAIALNRPDEIPADLIRPDLPQLQRPLPELDTLLTSALSNNLMLTALEHEVLANKASLKATQQQYGPTLAAGVELNEYDRNLPSRNTASVGLNLRFPLTGGSRSQADSARVTAELSAAQARYDQAKYSLRQQLSDLINRLEILQFKRETDKLRLNSTSLNVEQSRARYELEQQTTLGNSMAKYTEAEWLSAKNDFAIATTWAQIDLLTGKKLYQQREN